jgi:hypothetical protein
LVKVNNEWVLFWSDISQLEFGKKPDKEKIKEALQLSLAITKDTYKEFLTTAVSIKDTEIKDSN